ncbi:O-antigen ligase family protein [Chromohalobacter israelensis]|uniref:O-antigen ligase family protein n=1 Tax=Chromohalobacter israelensis TaxID=141390 RepID=UPI001CC4D9C8|nr:O-antigen ligase family protein [Chromohalobacter salexigens]MBZ5876635.1 O-antigen ligase family protein [Chromohalobacter salexigens]
MMIREFAWQCPRGVAIVGLSLLALYSALRILWPSVGEPAGTVMALFGLIAVLVWGKELRASAALWLLLAVVAVQVLSWVLGYFHHPDWVSSNPEVDRLAKLFIFIGIAWWLGGSTRWTLALWGVGVIGYVIAAFVHGGGVQEWLAGLNGQRVGFGIRNKQHGSMLFGVCLLGLIVFSRRVFMHSGQGRLSLMFGWVVLALISLTGVLIGQTRAVWLALCVAAVVGVAIWLMWLAKYHRARYVLRSVVIVACVLVVVGMGAMYAFKDTLSQRIARESPVIEKVLEGDLQNIPYSSVGIRINTWVAAGEWIAERPLVGWGGEGRGLVIDHTDWLPDDIKERFGHLHNFFLEVWVAYGLLGLGVIATLAFWIGRGTWLAWRAGVIPNDMALFGAAFFVYWMIVNQFESYNSFWTGVYVHNLIVGGLVTHIWRWQLESGQRVLAWPTRRST